MKTAFKVFMLMIVAMAVLAVLGGTALWHELGSQPGMSITVDGDEFNVTHIESVNWLGAVIGVFVAGLVCCIVLPLVLLLGVGLPLLIVGCVIAVVVAAVLSVGAVAFSPFILFVLLMVWLLKRSNNKTGKSKANIAA